MIDLSFKPKQQKKDDEMSDFAQFLTMVIFAGFFAVVLLSAIAGEPIF